MKNLFIGLLLALSDANYAQKGDTNFVKQLFETALSKGKSYEDLRSLCKDIGARLSGSAEAEMAVRWSFEKMKSYGFDTVYLMPVVVPHWERGTKEAAWIKLSNNKLVAVNILALGGSIGTNGLMEAEVIEFNSFEDLKKATKSKVEGKIVFLNQPMDAKAINTFKAYGGCAVIRGKGAIEAAKLGAKGIVIRSLAMPHDDHPHTGSMQYKDSVTKIPAAAMSTNDCEMLSNELKKGKISFIFEMDCRNYPNANSHNVIAERFGKNKNNIISFGGHLDSWDAGEGAHDDGAGVIHSLEALRMLTEMNYKPNNTLRLVFFMNEENGNAGGINYAKEVKKKGENHIAALESDRGGGVPQGFHVDGDPERVKLLKSFAPIFKQYELYEFEKGYGGVDIGPLKTEFPEIPLFGFVPNSQRYFDFHHSKNDVFENVNKRELELGCASVATLIYLLDLNL